MANQSGNLKVEILEARDLTNMDGLFGKNDAYVIVKVGSQKQKTNIIAKGGKNPVWNETFHFQANQGDEVEAEVYDYDKVKDDHIGTVKIPLDQVFQQGRTEIWYPISRGAKNGGEIFVRMHYQAAGTYSQGANVPMN